jgi:hypothetical protein
MKHLALVLILITQSVAAWSLTVNSRFNIDSSGAYFKEVQILCAADETSLCQNLCQSDTECRKPEPYCLNCAGTSSNLLRTLFTQISQNYVPTQNEISNDKVVQYLASQNYVLLNAQSVYNYYKPLNSSEMLSDLKNLCPASANNDPLLVVKLAADQQPEKLSFILCKDVTGQSYAYDVEVRQAEVGAQPYKFNLKLN